MANPIVYVDLASGVDEAAKTVSGATKANPCVVTCNSHGYSNGDEVYLYSVGGMTQLNGNRYTIGNVALNTFELTGINSTGYTTYTSGGAAQRKGTATAPFLTVNASVVPVGITEVRIAKTSAYTSIACSGAGVGWTANSVTVTTSSDLRASIAVGDYIGKTTASGNGAEETFYRVNGITASTITLEFKYGGTTATESTCNKIVIVTTGASNVTAITPVTGLTISGGWNLSGTPAQDGETWFTNNAPRTTAAAYVINGSGSITVSYSKLNIVEGALCIYSSNTSTVTNCTLHGYNYAQYQGATSDGVFASAVAVATFFSTVSVTNSFCQGIGWNAPNNFISTNNKFMGGTNGIVQGGTAGTLNNCIFQYLTIGISTLQSSQVVKNCTFESCTTGVTTGNTTNGHMIDTCTFSNCGTAFSISQSSGVQFTKCAFNACTIGVTYDTYSGSVFFDECTWLTPVTLGINRHINSGVTVCTGCSIDGASLAKAYNVTSSGYGTRQYLLNNSFQKNGTIYGNNNVFQDYSVFRTTAPSVAIGTVTTSTLSSLDLKVFSAYVNSGVSRTYSFYMKASSASWAGSVVVKWKLNGATIKTEVTPITSITTSWVQYSYTCDSSLITSDGELSLEFQPNTNAYSIYVDDIVVT